MKQSECNCKEIAEFYFLLNARKVKFLLNKGFASEILPLYKLPFYKNI